jgi:DNA-binding response OmpR family regulator
MRVILIDDDEDLRVATGLALKTGGYVPEGFANCDLAIEALSHSTTPPGAVLLDIHLDGGEITPERFVAWMRERGWSQVPVLIMSASADASRIAQSLGAAGTIPKPFDIAQLVDRVQRATH